MSFKNFWLEVANKTLYTQNVSLHELKLPVKRHFFYNYKILYPTLYIGNMVFAVLKNFVSQAIHREYDFAVLKNEWVKTLGIF